MRLSCPMCGCSQYEKEGEGLYYCMRCTVMFKDVKKFYSGGRHGMPTYGSRHEELSQPRKHYLPPDPPPLYKKG